MDLIYIVSYNTETQRWSVDDETMYIDGNIWDNREEEWSWATGPHDELVDSRCRNMLIALAPTWPKVDTENV